jgi:hypothetical protein
MKIVLPLKSSGFNSPNWVIPIELLELEVAILISYTIELGINKNRLFLLINPDNPAKILNGIIR